MTSCIVCTLPLVIGASIIMFITLHYLNWKTENRANWFTDGTVLGSIASLVIIIFWLTFMANLVAVNLWYI